MTVFLRQDLAIRLINHRFQGIDGFVADWELLASRRFGFPKPKKRATIYRWLSKGLPAKRGSFLVFGFCAVLDVDLLAILDYERSGYFKKFAKLRRIIYSRSSLDGTVSTLMQMYRPDDNWPSDAIAETCYGRPWFFKEIDNGGASDSTDYMLVKVKFLSPSVTCPISSDHA